MGTPGQLRQDRRPRPLLHPDDVIAFARRNVKVEPQRRGITWAARAVTSGHYTKKRTLPRGDGYRIIAPVAHGHVQASVGIRPQTRCHGKAGRLPAIWPSVQAHTEHPGSAQHQTVTLATRLPFIIRRIFRAGARFSQGMSRFRRPSRPVAASICSRLVRIHMHSSTPHRRPWHGRARAGGALVKLVYFGRFWYCESIPITVLTA